MESASSLQGEIYPLYLQEKKTKPLLPIIGALAIEVIFEVKHETSRFLFVLRMYMEGNQNPSVLALIHWMSMAKHIYVNNSFKLYHKKKENLLSQATEKLNAFKIIIF